MVLKPPPHADWKVHPGEIQHMARLLRWHVRLGQGAHTGGELGTDPGAVRGVGALLLCRLSVRNHTPQTRSLSYLDCLPTTLKNTEKY
jgi:hypothetical protein